MTEKGRRTLGKAAKDASEAWVKDPATVPVEISQLYNEIFTEAEALLRENWPAVLRVAHALLAAGELDQLFLRKKY